MPRKPKRQRDPERSHGRSLAVASPPRPLLHSERPQSGPGWVHLRLSTAAHSGLLDQLAVTALTGRAYHAHSEQGEQASDGPMKQRWLMGSAAWKTWKGVVEVALGCLSGIACPRCGGDMSGHTLFGADLNVISPGSALWPHIDLEDTVGSEGQGHVVCLVLLQASTAGGLLSLAKKPGECGMKWREAGTGPGAVARRRRDMMTVPLLESGDTCVVDGCSYLHEVTRVRGTMVRVTLSLQLSCGK